MTKHISYSILLEPQAEGGFTVTVPALPEVITEGANEAEALEMAKEAIRLALAYRKDKKLEIPNDLEPELHKIDVAISV